MLCTSPRRNSLRAGSACSVGLPVSGGKKTDPLYNNRKTVLTRIAFLTARQRQRREVLWQVDELMVILQVTWQIYQDIIAAYAHPKKSQGKKLMLKVMNSIRAGLPAGLEELAQLGRTLWRRRRDVVA